MYAMEFYRVGNTTQLISNPDTTYPINSSEHRHREYRHHGHCHHGHRHHGHRHYGHLHYGHLHYGHRPMVNVITKAKPYCGYCIHGNRDTDTVTIVTLPWQQSYRCYHGHRRDIDIANVTIETVTMEVVPSKRCV